MRVWLFINSIASPSPQSGNWTWKSQVSDHGLAFLVTSPNSGIYPVTLLGQKALLSQGIYKQFRSSVSGIRSRSQWIFISYYFTKCLSCCQCQQCLPYPFTLLFVSQISLQLESEDVGGTAIMNYKKFHNTLTVPSPTALPVGSLKKDLPDHSPQGVCQQPPFLLWNEERDGHTCSVDTEWCGVDQLRTGI